MEEIALPIGMAVAIWGGYGHLLKSYEILNRDRDRLIFGQIDDEPLSLEHQRLILRNDWVALHVGLVLYLVIFGVLFCISPLFLDEADRLLWALGIGMSICPFVAALSFAVGCWRDYGYLASLIEARERVARAEPGAPADVVVVASDTPLESLELGSG